MKAPLPFSGGRGFARFEPRPPLGCGKLTSMSRPPVLDMDDIVKAMALLHPDWDLTSGKLHRELTFPDFVSAFACMTEVALVAERIDHHPEWSNVYNRVIVDLATHDPVGITQLDLDLATAIDRSSGRQIAQ